MRIGIVGRSFGCAVGLVLVSWTGAAARGEVIKVGPGESIQDAIDIANDGDEIVVAPGTYAPIDFLGKNIVVRSSGGPEVTIIDAAGGPTGVRMFSGEPAGTELDGLTVTGGTGEIITLIMQGEAADSSLEVEPSSPSETVSLRKTMFTTTVALCTVGEFIKPLPPSPISTARFPSTRLPVSKARSAALS